MTSKQIKMILGSIDLLSDADAAETDVLVREMRAGITIEDIHQLYREIAERL